MAAATPRRRLTTGRQGTAGGGGTTDLTKLPCGHQGSGRRRRWRHTFQDDSVGRTGGDHPQPLGRGLLDALRRPQSLELESKMTVDVVFVGAIALDLLDPVAVPQQLEVLPCGKQQNRNEQAEDAERRPQLALPLLVDLTDDLIVANVLSDFVFKGACLIHPSSYAPPLPAFQLRCDRTAARNLALRARGLAATSSSVAVTGCFVSSETTASSPRARSRSVCLTTRSSSE